MGSSADLDRQEAVISELLGKAGWYDWDDPNVARLHLAHCVTYPFEHFEGGDELSMAFDHFVEEAEVVIDPELILEAMAAWFPNKVRIGSSRSKAT